MKTATAVALVCSGILAGEVAQAQQTLSVYHVGNSVTDTINYNGLDALAESKGNTHNWGRSMIPGAPLAWTWNHPANTISEPPYGTFTNALPNYTWNTVTLQPFDRHKGTAADPVPTTPGTTVSENDIPVVRGFINQALMNPANVDTQFYIYSRWPRRDDDGAGGYQPFDFQAKWDRTYTGGWDGTNESRDYFQDLTDDLNAISLGLNKSLLMVPVGDVLYELDKRMEAGQVPGFTDITGFYADGIHFNGHGSYVVGLTFYATLYKDTPVGLGVPTQYGTGISPEQAAVFQDAVWDVVAGHPYSGVAAVPEPASMGLMAGCLGLLVRRRRSQA